MNAALHQAHGRPPLSGLHAFLLGVLAVGLTNALSELVIYGQLIVPRIAGSDRVPLGAFALMYLPVLAACLWLGWRAGTIGNALWMACGASLVAQLEKAALAWAEASGHEASLALTGPTRFWTLHFVRMSAGFFVLVLAVHAARAWRARRLR